MRTLRWTAMVTALAAALPATAAAAGTGPTRYSLVHGCYSLSGVPGAQRVRMQATALGRYLLYRPDRTIVAAQPGGSVGVAAQPSAAADWRVTGGGSFTLTAAGTTLRHVISRRAYSQSVILTACRRRPGPRWPTRTAARCSSCCASARGR